LLDTPTEANEGLWWSKPFLKSKKTKFQIHMQRLWTT
jgi:hypothetical protein